MSILPVQAWADRISTPQENAQTPHRVAVALQDITFTSQRVALTLHQVAIKL
jgi:hypothetical protein